MEKKQYINPSMEVTQFGGDIVMQAFGSASMPNDNFNHAPKLVPNPTPKLSNDSVPVF